MCLIPSYKLVVDACVGGWYVHLFCSEVNIHLGCAPQNCNSVSQYRVYFLLNGYKLHVRIRILLDVIISGGNEHFGGRFTPCPPPPR